jgi:hypothetical protein
MQERSDSQPIANILYRGNTINRASQPMFPALPPMPASFPRNRLGWLSGWLIRPTADGALPNRFWQELFGKGW